jgi:hypothetical protein
VRQLSPQKWFYRKLNAVRATRGRPNHYIIRGPDKALRKLYLLSANATPNGIQNRPFGAKTGAIQNNVSFMKYIISSRRRIGYPFTLLNLITTKMASGTVPAQLGIDLSLNSDNKKYLTAQKHLISEAVIGEK